ncbi:MAG: galactokinase [Marinilabiliales bacterium]|nr:MAG: galactokinase [Marinilabiliales bacterium]
MSNSDIISNIQDKFNELFNGKALLIESPGRINLIGEHTDYNEGFVMPAAIDKSIFLAMAENQEGIFRFYSTDFGEEYTTTEITKNVGNKKWALYLMGVLAQFQKEKVKLKGINCVFGGNIPIGAGLSSSAALECGFAFGLNKIFNANFRDSELVKMAQQAEHEYAGVMCGIMDQYASVFGKKEQVFSLDCRTHEHSYYQLSMKNHLIALVDTKVKHELASSEYNQRRIECEKGVSVLQKYDEGISSLRDVNLDLINEHKSEFTETVYKRCTYIVKENQRVNEACNALENNDYDKFGDLMYLSHSGLKSEYEVSCKELDILVDLTQNMDFVLGSRMMGGGFGGCTINLIKSEYKEKFQDQISREYFLQTKINPEVYFVKLSDGVRNIVQKK